MSTFVKLCRDGFHRMKYNPDRRDACKVRKQADKTYSIFDKDDNLLASGFSDRYEADEFYYDDLGTDGLIFSVLREGLVIEPDVSVVCLADLVQSDVYLSSLASSLFPRLDEKHPDGAVRLSMRGDVVNGELVLRPIIEASGSEPLIDLSTEIFLYHDGTRHRGEHNWSVIDVLQALFGIISEERPRCRLTKDGVYNYLGESIDILDALSLYCDMDEGVTLLDIFHLVAEDEAAKAFLATYSWCSSIDDYHVEAEKIDKRFEFNYSLVSSSMDLVIRKNENDTKPFNFQVSYDFHVNGAVEEEERNRNPEYYKTVDNINYGVSMTPIGEYAYLPLHLENEITVKEYRTDLHEEKVLLTCHRDMTLLDILDAIYWEISFCGSPAQAAEFREGLMQSVEDIKSGNVDTVPLDDIIKEIEDKHKEEDGEYGQDSTDESQNSV